MNEDLVRTIWVLAVISIIVFLYLIYILVSFFFMNEFKKKINVKVEAINVIIYQKYQLEDQTSSLLIRNGHNNKELKSFDDSDAFKNYKKIDAKQFEQAFNNSESSYKLIKRICAEIKLDEELEQIKINLKLIDDLDSKYFESIQLYNTYVVGYNYWRNLLFTRWIKVLFRKDEIDTIK